MKIRTLSQKGFEHLDLALDATQQIYAGQGDDARRDRIRTLRGCLWLTDLEGLTELLFHVQVMSDDMFVEVDPDDL